MEMKWYTEAPTHDVKASLERVEGTIRAYYSGHRIQSDIKSLETRAAALRELARKEAGK